MFYTSSVWNRFGLGNISNFGYALWVTLSMAFASLMTGFGAVIANAEPATQNPFFLILPALIVVGSLHLWRGRDGFFPVSALWLSFIALFCGYLAESALITVAPVNDLAKVFIPTSLLVCGVGIIRSVLPIIRDNELVTFIVYFLGLFVGVFVVNNTVLSTRQLTTLEVVVTFTWGALLTIDTMRSIHIPHTRDNAVDAAIGVYTDAIIPERLLDRLTPVYNR